MIQIYNIDSSTGTGLNTIRHHINEVLLKVTNTVRVTPDLLNQLNVKASNGSDMSNENLCAFLDSIISKIRDTKMKSLLRDEKRVLYACMMLILDVGKSEEGYTEDMALAVASGKESSITIYPIKNLAIRAKVFYSGLEIGLGMLTDDEIHNSTEVSYTMRAAMTDYMKRVESLSEYFGVVFESLSFLD